MLVLAKTESATIVARETSNVSLLIETKSESGTRSMPNVDVDSSHAHNRKNVHKANHKLLIFMG